MEERYVQTSIEAEKQQCVYHKTSSVGTTTEAEALSERTCTALNGVRVKNTAATVKSTLLNESFEPPETGFSKVSRNLDPKTCLFPHGETRTYRATEI